MSRQIRISDDVAELVEGYQLAQGLKSLSAAANQMLASAVGLVDYDAPWVRPVESPGTASASNGPVAVAHQPEEPVELTRLPARPLDLQVGPRGGCAHPILARTGSHCGTCGASLT